MKLKQLINFNYLSFDNICKRIEKGRYFSLARYGDGEFYAILNYSGTNCDNHPYTPAMGEMLARILAKSPTYHIGLHQAQVLNDETLDWLSKHNLLERNFVSNAVFHCAVRDDLMGPFWDALKWRKVAIIAPEYVRAQIKVKANRFIPIPGRNTFKHLPQVIDELDKYDFANHVTLISASMCAPILVDYLHTQYGSRASFIDFGSSWDPYLGLKTRSFHKPKNKTI